MCAQSVQHRIKDGMNRAAVHTGGSCSTIVTLRRLPAEAGDSLPAGAALDLLPTLAGFDRASCSLNARGRQYTRSTMLDSYQ
jgi:hypothetical protein